MKIKGIEFPKPLLKALREGKLVVFAGAGVSMGSPAGLPSFRELSEAIAQGTGEVLNEGEPEDQFLGRLQYKEQNVHARAAQVLSRNNAQPTDLHRDLIRLFQNPALTRVVTTNFDLLFESAAEQIFQSFPAVYTAPALPLGHRFEGIVHLHGSLSSESDMVLTDSDFGRAYLTEGWARRFLVDLFNSYTVLFVGYSHNDSVMNYLARALPTETARFVLTDESVGGRWQRLGIRPIIYPESSTVDFSSLYSGVNGLANYVTRGILDWEREIKEIAQKPPSLDDEASDVIHEALSDEMRTRFFVASASQTEWIEWLERHGYLDNLFGRGPADIPGQDAFLGYWLAEKFVRNHSDALFRLLARHSLQVHPAFWFALARTVGSEPSLEQLDLQRWVSCLLGSAPPTQAKYALISLSQRCIEAGLTDSLVDIFAVLAESRLLFKETPAVYAEFMDSPIDAELADNCDYSDLHRIWISGLRPKLDQVAERLLSLVVGQFDTRHRTLLVWQTGIGEWFRRSAIEPHEQDRFPQTVDALIDAGRDCLEYLAENKVATAANWCDWLVRQDVPILRRLAVHTLPLRKDISADEKVDWLLANTGLSNLEAHHEIFQAMRVIYPLTSWAKRKTAIDEVLSYEWPVAEDEDRERLAAYHHFSWLHWLNESDPACEQANRSLEEIWKRFPKFEQRDHPDLNMYITPLRSMEPQTPWSASELLSRSAVEWADELVSFQVESLMMPSRAGLLLAVEEAVKQRFEWGIDLADCLAERRNWETDLWSPIIRGWTQELDVDKHRQVLGKLVISKLSAIHGRPIADLLLKLVKDGGLSYVAELLADANQVAIALWDCLDRTQPKLSERDWLFNAINHPAGVLTEYWLHGIALLGGYRVDLSNSLVQQCYAALTAMVKDNTPVGTYSKAVIASQMGFVLNTNENWAMQHLIPLFEHAEGDGSQAVWDGLLYGPLSPQVADSLKEAFLKAVPLIEEFFPAGGDTRQHFVSFYAWMVTYFVDQPLEVWIPRFFENANAEDRRRFAWAVGNSLDGGERDQQKEWWARWLKRYWENRLQGIPAGLDAGEVESMIEWLPL